MDYNFFLKFLSEFSCRLDTKFSSEGGEGEGEAVGQLIYRMNAYIWWTQKHMPQLEDTVYAK